MNKKKVLLLVICCLLVTFLAILIKKTNTEIFNVKISNSFSELEGQIVETWEVGSNVTAKLYGDGNLIISGSGTMKSNLSSSIWEGYEEYKEQIKNVIIEEGVEDISAYAFSGCTNLVSVEIPNTITTIWQHAFVDCKNLKSITIPSGCAEIGRQLIVTNGIVNISESGVFTGCESLESINVDSENAVYSSADGVLFNKNQTILKYYPIGKKDTQYSIPVGVTQIVSLNCNNLRNIYIPSTVTNLGESVDILGITLYLGTPFGTCDNLEIINVDNGNTKYCSIDGILFNKDKTVILRYPPAKEDVTKYKIPDTVTDIGSAAFGKCNNLINVEIPKGVTISPMAFMKCSNLKSLEILENTKVGQGAFAFCTNLADIKIAEETILENYTFRGCTGLKNVKIPQNVQIVGNIFEEAKLTLEIKEDESEQANIEILSRALDKDDILYAEENFELVNCEWNEHKALKINNEIASVKVGAGALSGLTITLNVTKEEKLVLETKSNVYNLQEAYITKIEHQTTQENFKQNIETNAELITILNQDNEPLTDEIIGTGMTVIFKLGEETQSFKLVVAGDTTGDGKADFKDIVAINKHRLNKNILEGAYLIAGEVTGDDMVDFKDIVKINKFRLNKITQLF